MKDLSREQVKVLLREEIRRDMGDMGLLEEVFRDLGFKGEMEGLLAVAREMYLAGLAARINSVLRAYTLDSERTRRVAGRMAEEHRILYDAFVKRGFSKREALYQLRGQY